MSVTYVTAFHPVRSGIETYTEKFDLFASLGIPIVVFLDKNCVLPKEYPNVKVIPASLEMDWIPKDAVLPNQRSETKDTRDYLVLMLHKMKYMNEALAYCDTPYLAWIDFGISHISRYPRTTFQKLVHLQSFSQPLTTIMSPGCWGQNSNFVKDSVYWRFCGGFFLGPRDVFAKAYQRQNELVKQYLPSLTWEVNYWALMDEMFSWYSANHDDTMITNFPYGPSIQRLTNEPHYLAGNRKVSVGGPIESYVYSILQPNMTAVFPKTDMLVESNEFKRMRESTTWADPAIHDYSDIIAKVQSRHPIVCVDTARNMGEKVLLLPSDDNTFENGLTFDNVLPEWNSRKSQVVWRGASSGCEWPSLRFKTIQALDGHSFADVKFVTGGWPENDAQIPATLFGDRMSIEEQLQYKYMLSIDGNGSASNIEWIFASGSVPVFVIGHGVDFWFRSLLKDGVNCILASPADVVGRIAWLVEHDEEARRIALNAAEFGRTIFTPEYQRKYLRDRIESMIPYAYDWSEFRQPKGEHHTLLTRLAREYKNSVIIDIGTHLGASAYSLSREPSNHVYSFDILHKQSLPIIPNVSYHLDNIMSPEGREKWKDILLNSAFMLLDIDPHDGYLEYEFYEWLRDNNYQGFVVCDDIWLFEGMRKNFWYKIPYEHKIDVTDEGHTYSGTGVFRFQPSERWPANPDISNWTVVTGYFDLTRMPDASPSIRSRPFEHYLQHSTSTLMLDQNMVVFCEPHTYEYIRAKRPENLQSKTKYIVMNFEDFPMCKYRELMNENRRRVPDSDDRNTVSYYLLCMARYAMLKRAIAENPFGSTHFLWLNICIERMGIRNVRELPRVFQVQRNKFSTCYIDYQPPENYLENVMRWGKCSMCSGFFTGNAHYMKEFCDRIENKFVECAKLGYGHADEQLFSLVYFDKPDIFEVYYGDYTEMITNYEWVKERCSEPLRLLIQHSYDAKDFTTCFPACEKLLESCKRGYAVLSADEMRHLLSIRKEVAKP